MYSSLKDYANISMVCKTIDKNVISKFKETREQGYSCELVVENCLTSIQLGLIYKLLKVSRFQDNDRSKFSINCCSIGFLNEIIFPYVKTVLVEDLNSIMEGKCKLINEIDDSDPIDFRTCLTSIQKLKILDDNAFTESGLEFQYHINKYIKYWLESDVIVSFNGISKYKVRNKIKEMLICLSDSSSDVENGM